MSGEVITLFTHVLVAKHSLWPRLDRCGTGSNPVDGLSRNDMKGEWVLRPIVFPPDLLSRLSAYLGR